MRFAAMLNAEGFELSDVSEASLEFEAPTEHDWYTYCTSTLLSANGHRSSYKVDMSGTTVDE